MAKINIEDIQKEVENQGWRLLSDEYKNLDSQLILECPEGHQVFTTWKKSRNNLECPSCKTNIYKRDDEKIIPKRGKVRVLALDQASHDSGWSILDDGKLIKYGVYKLSNNDETSRINNLKNWFISMAAIWKPDYIALEGIQYQDSVAGGSKMGITVFQTLARLQGVLMDTCFELKIPFEICHTQIWRAACGVKGRTRADKKKSMQVLVKKWYDITVTNDEADAIGIGRFLSEKISKSAIVEDWE